MAVPCIVHQYYLNVFVTDVAGAMVVFHWSSSAFFTLDKDALGACRVVATAYELCIPNDDSHNLLLIGVLDPK